MGAATWLAHTAYEYGRFLLARGGGDRERADGAARRGGGAGRAIGMPALLGRIRALGVALATAAGLPDGLSAARGADPRRSSPAA